MELADRPGQLHYLIEYGRTLLRLNDPTGHDVLAEACGQVLAAAGAPAAPCPTVALLLEYLLTVSPEQSRSRISRAQARGLVMHWFPNSPPLLWHLAQAAFQSGDFRDAASLLEHVIRLGQTGTFDRSAPFDPGVMGEPALLNLGLCYTRLGELDRAELCFGPLLTSPAHHAKARQGYDLVQQMRRHPRPG
jgi:hypothetical protein